MLSILALVLGLLCIPILDPVTNRRCRVFVRARRIKALPPPLSPGEVEALEKALTAQVEEWVRNLEHGFVYLAADNERLIRKLRKRLASVHRVSAPRTSLESSTVKRKKMEIKKQIATYNAIKKADLLHGRTDLAAKISFEIHKLERQLEKL